jgi:Pyruvate/2-oxoacid:ferredoxin oxidoreductase gamma subunit
MNLPSLDKFESIVLAGGLIIYDSSLINRPPARSDVEVIAIPATELADKLGNTRIANMIILGAYIEYTSVLRRENVFDALPNFLKKKTLLPLNRTAVEKGMEFMRENVI